MAVVESLLFFFSTVVLPPFLILLFVSLVLASFGKSLGLRKIYVTSLLQVFEGNQELQIAKGGNIVSDECQAIPTSVVHGRSTNLSYFSVNSDGTVSFVKAERWRGEYDGNDHFNDLELGTSQYGRVKIEKAENRRKLSVVDEEENVDSPNGLNTSVITREGVVMVPEPDRQGGVLPRNRSFDTFKREFHLSDVFDFVKAGVESIIEDEVTQRFSAEELPSWNLLTRTNRNYHYISMKLTVIWVAGWFFRYFFLLPTRLFLQIVGVGWLCICTASIGYLPENRFKKWLNWHVSLMCFRILSRACSATITYHDRENRAKGGGICVANHTSPIDVVILACDNCYALIGQTHGGFLGVLQRALARAGDHIWFERSEIRDRHFVTKRLRDHVEDPTKLPILIFPEGTCINNTSVMQFKKGSFEIGGTIYPVAIKYDPQFGDPFWNSSQYSMMHYLLMMMTSWAIVCDVWYLPPMTMREGENAIDFANRVKAEIARKGGLVDLVWDGQLKRITAKKEWKEKQQEEYSRRIKLD